MDARVRGGLSAQVHTAAGYPCSPFRARPFLSLQPPVLPPPLPPSRWEAPVSEPPPPGLGHSNQGKVMSWLDVSQALPDRRGDGWGALSPLFLLPGL